MPSITVSVAQQVLVLSVPTHTLPSNKSSVQVSSLQVRMVMQQPSPAKSFITILYSDPSFISGTSTYAVASVSASDLSGLDDNDLRTIVVSGTNGLDKIGNGFHVRRLNQYSGSLKTDIILVAGDTDGNTTPANLLAGLSGAFGALANVTASWMRTDTFAAVGGAIGAVRGCPCLAA